MALINITNIIVENTPAPFVSPFSFKITFECNQNLKEEVEWRLIYVGSSKDEKYDQVLDSFSMDNLKAGVMQFQLESAPPNYQLIPSKDDLFGVTALILSVSYRKQEFFRCGYYVYNEYINPDFLLNEPSEILISQIRRSILSDKPRITRFSIDWGIQEDFEKELYLGSNLKNANATQGFALMDSTNTQNNTFNSNFNNSFNNNGKAGLELGFDPFISNGIFNQIGGLPSLESSLMTGWMNNTNGMGFN